MPAHAHTLHQPVSLNRTALLATLHCLTGCAVGEVLGMIVGTALGWGSAGTIALSVTLAFAFGYGLTMLPLLRSGLALAIALPLAFASDSLSIGLMELADNGVMLTVPGAMEAGLADALFWGALGFALVVAFVAAYPLNRWLIARGRGHAVVHAHHGHGGHGDAVPAGSTRQLVLLGVAAVSLTLVVTVGAALLLEGREAHDGPSMSAEAR